MNDCILHKRVSLNSSPAPFMPSNRWSQPLCIPVHVYEVRPRKDHRGHDLISDALPFGRLWYTEIPHAIGYAEFYSRSHDAIIGVFDLVGHTVDAHEQGGRFQRVVSSLSNRRGRVFSQIPG